MRATVAVLLLLGICVAQSDLPFDIKKDFVLTETEAVGLMPPKVICDFAFSQHAWSPDGKYILIARTDPKINVGQVRSGIVQGAIQKPVPEASIVVVDVAKGTAQTVWTSRESPLKISNMGWIPETKTAMFVTTTQMEGTPAVQSKLFTAGVDMPKAQLTLAGQPDETMEVLISPSSPRGIVRLQMPWRAVAVAAGGRPSTPNLPEVKFAELGANGRIGRMGQAPLVLTEAPVGWTADGSRPMFFVYGREGDAEYVFDFVAWKEQRVSGIEYYKPKADTDPVFVEMRKTNVEVGNRTDEVPVAWLKSKIQSRQQSALIGMNAVAAMSPTHDAVLYVQQGVTLLRPLVRVPRAAYEQTMSEEEKARLIREAKQCATALMMYSADYDDSFPLNNGGLTDTVDPYMKNRAMLEDFIYTFGGGLLGASGDPSKTELGYKRGSNGRAVAYADGSVRWIPNK